MNCTVRFARTSRVVTVSRNERFPGNGDVTHGVFTHVAARPYHAETGALRRPGSFCKTISSRTTIRTVA